MEEDQAARMLLDPTTNQQNADRVSKIWEPLVVKWNRPKLLSLFCSFNRAGKMGSGASAGSKQTSQDAEPYKSMAAVPAGVLRIIASKAYLAADCQGVVGNAAASADQVSCEP